MKGNKNSKNAAGVLKRMNKIAARALKDRATSGASAKGARGKKN